MLVYFLQVEHAICDLQSQTMTDGHPGTWYIEQRRVFASLLRMEVLHQLRSKTCQIEPAQERVFLTGSSFALIAKRGIRMANKESVEEASR